jgi:hypothetical protein
MVPRGNSESEQKRLIRLIAQCDAMIAELRDRGTSGDLEIAAYLDQVRVELQKQFGASLRDEERERLAQGCSGAAGQGLEP